ncbi:WhiB family transcriptional regulator [Nonomuraea wenchangensis]|uniref:Transcription factor WhiB n=1 Tax=Nonomuraea wenchangensis TaxID=568860 RepID=A0A1I0LTK0_9ACTN|nr:WhiB family transcriptional regulator [Nonomuraea wenchangensis]SEU46415.1 Transcription factor WhiB [Nonomuraea wenchangensis]
MSRGYRSAPDPYRSGPIDIPQEPEWFADAACHRIGHELFFGPAADEDKTETTQEKEDREARAKALCAGCEVRVKCAQYERGFAEPIQRGGVWHGDNYHERQLDHRKEQRRAADRRRRNKEKGQV